MYAESVPKAIWKPLRLCALQTCFYNVCIYCTCMYSIAKYLGHHLPGLAVPVARSGGRALAVMNSCPATDSSSVFFSSTVCFVVVYTVQLHTSIYMYMYKYINKYICTSIYMYMYSCMAHTHHTVYLTSFPCWQIKGFKDYVELYVKGDQSQAEEEIPRKVVYESVNQRWEVAVTASNHGFQQASYVNSIATTKVGHISTESVHGIVLSMYMYMPTRSRQLIFLRKSDCLWCAVLLCLVVCLTLLASFFLPSHLSLKHVHIHVYNSREVLT